MSSPRHLARDASTASHLVRNVVASVGLLGAAASVAGLATFATFTDSESVSQPISSGVVDINLGAAGTAANRLTVAATAIVPGDTIQRAFTLSNASTDELGSITLTTSATTTSLLDTDTTDGLQMLIEKCSVPWTESGTSPAFTYTCAGTTTTVLASRAIIGSNLSLSNVALTAAATDYLRLSVSLPSTAGNAFQNLSSTVQYAFTATQRTAEGA